MTEKTKIIQVDYLARVEGEGAMYVRIDDDKVTDVKLKIFEPPRFFEAFLRGRPHTEAPDITARICGICPVAYQMSAVHAIESISAVILPDYLRDLRRLLYCGEWIASHTLHMYMLHIPDFLGYAGAVEMAKDHGDIVRRGLELKKAGNAIMATLGGREVHPINVRVGGFYKLPNRTEMKTLGQILRHARDLAQETLDWIATLDFPDLERDYIFVALRHESEYPFNEGRIVSSQGLNIPVEEFPDHFEEIHVEHSTALHGRTKDGKAYFVGPMARFNLNFDRLPEAIQMAAKAVGLEHPVKNPFRSLLVRALETVYACDEALRIIEAFRPADPYVEVPVVAGTGHAITEAPRGLLYHRYTLDDQGIIQDAVITPPTSQNQPTIEEDLFDLVNQNLHLPDDELQHLCEQSIRNYDPCISCATHFLNMKVERNR